MTVPTNSTPSRRRLSLSLPIWMAIIAFGIITIARANSPLTNSSQEKPKPGVQGVVLDSDGKPAKNVRIFYSTREGEPLPWGRVIAKTNTDNDGKFHVPWPSKDGELPTDRWDAIWAYQPGSVVASGLIAGHQPLETSDIRLSLDTPGRTIFDVRSPDGLPIAGARIKPRGITGSFHGVPDGLAELIEAGTVTDAKGRAIMTAFHPEEVRTVFVSAKGYGSQQFGFGLRDVELGPKVITLVPVGRVQGKIVGPLNTVKGRHLTVATNSREHPAPYPGLFYPQFDDEGRFDVPEIAVGNLRVSLDSDIKTPWFARTEPGLKVEAGQTTEVELELKPVMPVTGIVREKASKSPIAGILVWSRSPANSAGATTATDENGRFHGYLPLGANYLVVSALPESFASLNFGVPDVKVTDKEPVFELPPIELARAGTIKGIVVDDHDKPISGAVIEASWKVDEGANRNGLCKRTFRSDIQGRFVIPRVPLYSKAEIFANYRGLTLPRLVDARPDEEAELRLRLDASRAKSLPGRVLDTKGNPIAGARLRIRRAVRYDSTSPIEREEAIDVSDVPPLVTDKDGAYQTPKYLDKSEEYAVYVSAKGYKTARTTWTSAVGDSFPNLILEREPEPSDLKKK
jgi:hypothetical protein